VAGIAKQLTIRQKIHLIATVSALICISDESDLPASEILRALDLGSGASDTAPPSLIPLIRAAEILGCSPKTLYNQASSGLGQLPMVKIGSRTMFRLSDLVAYIADNRVRSTSEARGKRHG
jgi:hypothetical protein